MKKTFFDYVNILKEGPMNYGLSNKGPQQDILSKYEGLKELVQQVVALNAKWIQFEQQVSLGRADARKAGFGMSKQYTGMKKTIKELQEEVQEWKVNYEKARQSFDKTISFYQNQVQELKATGENVSSDLKIMQMEMEEKLHLKSQEFTQTDQKVKQLEAKLQRVFASKQEDTTEAQQIMDELMGELDAVNKEHSELKAVHSSLQQMYDKVSANKVYVDKTLNQPKVDHTTNIGQTIKEFMNSSRKKAKTY